ncbi:tetratricopeptide repeat protein [Saccharospirillum mangrovi]|uniref:tetratricopeptide repeat protein n=1 Tax=Saccharospirillum mangrovi TaxID=2161747 RepID=UPI0013B35B9D|nr:tetratricopeptide repeat protein [Saccharospirillum mangrovi]
MPLPTHQDSRYRMKSAHTEHRPYAFRSLVTLVLLSLILSGCASGLTVPGSTASPSPRSAPQPTEPAAPEIATTPLDGQSFYQLLLAEIATNRGDFGAAAELYSHLDNRTDDAQIARRASALMQLVNDYGRMQPHASHWVQLEPEVAEAWQALAVSSFANGDFVTGEQALNEWLTRFPQAPAETALIGTGYLPTDRKLELAAIYQRLQSQYPRSAALPYGAARLLTEAGDFDTAYTEVTRSRQLSDSPGAGLLAYRIHLERNELDAAHELIADLAEQYPDNSQVASAYASFAYSQGMADKSEVLESLFNRFPNEPLIVRTFARESFEAGDYDTAEALFKRLVQSAHADEAQYYLGRINVENARPELAAEHFLAVQQPPYLISALAELTELWAQDRLDELRQQLAQARVNFPEQNAILWRLEAGALRSRGDAEQAISILDQGLDQNPRDISLLYDQALIATSLERFELADANLSTVLELDPNNASALNALGYTWADRNLNLAQAQDYIDRALALEPEDPAIMDSKGWIEYRLGNLSVAEDWLRKALGAFDNDEVAAHLAEVLWVQGEQEEARRWLRHAFELNADSPTATGVVDRFKVDL